MIKKKFRKPKKKRETKNRKLYLAARKKKQHTHTLNGNYFIKSILLTENVRQIKKI